ncbi:uncharacterized protein LOC111557235 [Felis catus]|uniref:uncharacterized protein LOC111557235 n=1 Tax=Felis catus TaxID=9685 RepID=UPI001D1A2C14|nr:uncharacterized protein LOC111557235 [Felis catus]
MAASQREHAAGVGRSALSPGGALSPGRALSPGGALSPGDALSPGGALGPGGALSPGDALGPGARSALRSRSAPGARSGPGGALSRRETPAWRDRASRARDAPDASPDLCLGEGPCGRGAPPRRAEDRVPSTAEVPQAQGGRQPGLLVGAQSLRHIVTEGPKDVLDMPLPDLPSASQPQPIHKALPRPRQCMVTATTGSESRSPQGVTNKMVGVRGREEAGPPPSAAVPARVSRKPARRQIGGFTQGTWVVKFRNTDFQRQPQSTWCWSPDDSHPHPGFLRRPSRSPRLVEWGKERLCARALSSAFPSGSSPPVAEAGPTTGLCVLTLHWCRVAEL